MTYVLPAVYVFCIGVYTSSQIRRFRRQGEKRKAWLYAVFMATSAVIGALLIAGVPLPSLVVPYKVVFEPIGKKLLSP
ncbi:hypothetical protein LJK88_21810 [Paenibacillus sp. P26]|nr:hypothetical protein LJK88_21810 [Paenibacillus sp. P26]